MKCHNVRKNGLFILPVWKATATWDKNWFDKKFFELGKITSGQSGTKWQTVQTFGSNVSVHIQSVYYKEEFYRGQM
jgi:hypothetical protein